MANASSSLLPQGIVYKNPKAKDALNQRHLRDNTPAPLVLGREQTVANGPRRASQHSIGTGSAAVRSSTMIAWQQHGRRFAHAIRRASAETGGWLFDVNAASGAPESHSFAYATK
jgi:hypothetical protein